jgi:DNA-binding beta-propeller fold protein YncE
LPLAEKPHEIAVTKDGRTAFVTLFGVRDYDMRIGTPGQEIAVVDLVRGEVSTRWHLPQAPDGSTLAAPHGVKLRPPRDSELFVNTEVGSSQMVVFDSRNGKVKRMFPLPSGAHNFIFTADGKALYVFAGATGVIKLDAVSGKELARVSLGTPVRGLAWTTHRKQLIAAARGEIALLEPSDLSVVRKIAIAGTGQLFYPYAVDRWILVPGGPKGQLNVIESDSGSLVRALDTGVTPIIVQVGPDRRAYVANVEDDHLSAVDLSSFTTERLGNLHGPNGLAFGACPRNLK